MGFAQIKSSSNNLDFFLNQKSKTVSHSRMTCSKVTEIDQETVYHKETFCDEQSTEEMAAEIVRLKKQLKSKNKLIKEQSDELEKLDAIKNKFFNVVSHDLKGPLCGLSGFINMVIESPDKLNKDGIIDVTKQLKESIDGTIQLADNLITWAQSQMKEFDIHPVIIYPKELLHDVIELSKAAAHEKNITVTHSTNDRMVLFADKNQLTFILRNLLNNAIKFTQRGGMININILENELGESILSVKDSGIGLTESQLNNLFLPITNKSTLGTSGEKGTGLGLTLVEEFVQMHGGKIEVNSKKGVGSTFKIILNPLVLNEKVLAI